jgi:lipooligosaccharide transport system permease protein
MRGLTTGAVHVGLLGHLGYFLVMIVGGLVVAGRRLDILLLK